MMFVGFVEIKKDDEKNVFLVRIFEDEGNDEEWKRGKKEWIIEGDEMERIRNEVKRIVEEKGELISECWVEVKEGEERKEYKWERLMSYGEVKYD